MEKITSHSQSDTRKGVEKIFKRIIETQNKKGATVIGLLGELGAGKTTFVQYLGDILGINELMTSPTFVIQKKYDLKDKSFDTLYHIDAYRLKGGDELLALGWQEMITNPKNLIVIEWAERVGDSLPSTAHSVSLTHAGENSREIELKS